MSASSNQAMDIHAVRHGQHAVRHGHGWACFFPVRQVKRNNGHSKLHEFMALPCSPCSPSDDPKPHVAKHAGTWFSYVHRFPERDDGGRVRPQANTNNLGICYVRSSTRQWQVSTYTTYNLLQRQRRKYVETPFADGFQSEEDCCTRSKKVQEQRKKSGQGSVVLPNAPSYY